MKRTLHRLSAKFLATSAVIGSVALGAAPTIASANYGGHDRYDGHYQNYNDNYWPYMYMYSKYDNDRRFMNYYNRYDDDCFYWNY